MTDKQKIKEKIQEKFIDFIPKSIVEIATLSGISIFTLIAYISGFLKYSFEIKVWQCVLVIVGVILVVIIVRIILLKLKSKQKYPEGTKVTLVSNSHPIMSAGKYNYLNNKVECIWYVDKSIKNELINQNLLKEYQEPVYSPRPRTDFLGNNRITF